MPPEPHDPLMELIKILARHQARLDYTDGAKNGETVIKDSLQAMETPTGGNRGRKAKADRTGSISTER